jgi:hypothetical protein
MKKIDIENAPTRVGSICEYPDIDLRADPSGFVHKDGRGYPTTPRGG